MISFRVIDGVAQHFAGRLSEWGFGVIFLLWGTALCTGFSTLNSPSFVVLRGLTSPQHLGIVLLALAIARLVALTLNGTFNWSTIPSLCVRSISALLYCFFWFTLIVGVYISSPDAPGIFTYVVLLGMDAFLAAWTAGGAGHRVRAVRNGGV